MDSRKIDPSLKDILPLVSMRKLEFILGFKRNILKEVSAKAESYYNPFNKQKLNKLRRIDNPTGKLKTIQGRIYKRLLKKIPLPDGMMGGVSGKSFIDNAEIHVDKGVVVTMDLRDCFPRVKDKIIFKVFREHLQCSEEIAKLLTRLTTYKTYLPQGAPTSTILANLSLIPMFTEMKIIASKNGLSLTLFVDDISLSGPNADKFVDQFIKIIQKNGHAVRQKKVKVMRQAKRQQVTGIVVNKRQAVPKNKIQDYKNTIFALAKSGASLNEKDLNSVLGKIESVRNVSSSQAKELIRLALRYLPLAEKTKKRLMKL